MESGFYSSEDGNRIFVVFGGKIGVVQNKVEKQAGIYLQELDNTHEIGEYRPEEFNEEKTTIHLLFEDAKSIDILIEDLLEAKNELEK